MDSVKCSEKKPKARIIAFYLPQYHPIPENDRWWGKGFTEWTNVAKARKLFPGHYQPHIPADLGFYDLRVPETRQAQADMAKKYGIEGFCWWHYWFGNGKRLLERPFEEVLASGRPDFPFCLAWANESWQGFWHGLGDREVLIEQKYPGKEDYAAHFNAVLPALKDSRYITVDGKPLFMIYRPLNAPEEISEFMRIWREMAAENGLKGIYFVCQTYEPGRELAPLQGLGFDAVNIVRMYDFEKKQPSVKRRAKFLQKIFRRLTIVPYGKACRWFVDNGMDSQDGIIPTIIPNWDHSPRTGRNAFILHASTPELFRTHVDDVLEVLKDKPEEHRIAFVKSWNEWAEGNYLEPDMKFGTGYLKVLGEELYK